MKNTRSAKRIGRGPGSGKGKTAGRGQKGQNARGKIPIGHSHYEGGQRALFKRLPYRRGKGNKSLKNKPLIVDLLALNKLPKNSVVDLKALIENRIVDKNDAQALGVKILGIGELQNALTIKLPISKSAARKVEKAGGKIIAVEKPTKRIGLHSRSEAQQLPGEHSGSEQGKSKSQKSKKTDKK